MEALDVKKLLWELEAVVGVALLIDPPHWHQFGCSRFAKHLASSGCEAKHRQETVKKPSVKRGGAQVLRAKADALKPRNPRERNDFVEIQENTGLPPEQEARANGRNRASNTATDCRL